MPNPRKQKITTNSFTKTKQVEKQTDWEWKTKQNRKEKEKCSVGWNDSATSYRAYNSGNCDNVLCIHWGKSQSAVQWNLY